MNNPSSHIKRTRLPFFWNLVLFLFLLACTENKKQDVGITIQWNGEKAEAVNIPLSLLPGVSPDSIAEHLQVRLTNSAVPVIHDYLKPGNGSITFKPLISFTLGLRYEVFYSGRLLGTFEIPPVNTENRAEVVSVYPTTDILPENALKLYVVFSKPMQEGQALNNITVIKNESDTLRSTFLGLDQELWNKERTILTLWFDPGRIKRDLQPNKNLGTPLLENNSYKILIGQDWRDERGITLKKAYQKNFLAGKRDSMSPNPDRWTVHPPKTSAKDSLRIDLHESLDYILLKNAIHITDNKGNNIKGTFETSAKEAILTFVPDEIWKPGEYTINIESRLEDLAGNNLNRLFDRDITGSGNKEQKTIFTKRFRVE